jgi:hypothetical protein
VLTRINLPWK